MARYLYVEMIDSWGAYNDYMYLDCLTTNRRRIVKVELTDEQERLLTPRKVGKSGDKDVYEDYRLICIQDDGMPGLEVG